MATPKKDKEVGNNIKVCVRVRPWLPREAGEVCCVTMPSKTRTVVTKEGEEKVFDFDRSYWSHTKDHKFFSTQETLMDELGNDIIENACNGFNNCLFAYGQTGSGKTFSVLGSDDPPENRGLLPRIIENLFMKINDMEAEGGHCQCVVSYLEIYNENILDLLRPESERAKEKKLEVRQNPIYGTYVPGLCECPVPDYSEVKKLQDFGAKQRTIGATNMNAGSSRSHCIFIFQLDRNGKHSDGRDLQLKARVNLVDLAGSERSGKTGAEGARLKEGAMINQSLTNLALVIQKLSEASTKGASAADFVPYRNSKLTHILQESLSGNSMTIMMAAISPAPSNFEETVGTLRFAQLCKSVVTHARQNDLSPAEVSSNLQADIDALKELAAKGNNPEVIQKLKESEELAQQLRKDYEEKMKEWQHTEQIREQAMDDGGLSFEELAEQYGLSANLPKLVNISDDPSLSGALLYLLETGVLTKVGDNAACRINLSGIGIHEYMCQFFNDDDRIVTLTLLSPDGSEVINKDGYDAYKKARAAGLPETRVLVNGARAASPMELNHLDRLLIGWSHAFRVLVPNVTTKRLNMRKSVLQACDTSIELMLAEVCAEDPQEVEEVRALFDDLKTKIDSSHLNRFLAVFREALPLVREGNMITSTMRPSDGLRFQIEISFNIQRFGTSEPGLVVRLYEKTEGGEEEVVDVWEVDMFKERLEQMRTLYRVKRMQGRKSVNLAHLTAGEDPWATYTCADLDMLVAPLKTEMATLGIELERRRILSIEEGSAPGLRQVVASLKRELSAKVALKSELEGTMEALIHPNFEAEHIRSPPRIDYIMRAPRVWPSDPGGRFWRP